MGRDFILYLCESNFISSGKLFAYRLVRGPSPQED